LVRARALATKGWWDRSGKIFALLQLFFRSVLVQQFGYPGVALYLGMA
jgi:hypothetical protein